MISRRRFTAGVAIALTPLGARASAQEYKAQQAGKMYRIGFLQTVPDTPRTNFLEVFRQGLRDLGYAEGQNIVIEYRMSQEPKDNPGLLADLIGRRIDLLVTWSTPALVAAKQAVCGEQRAHQGEHQSDGNANINGHGTLNRTRCSTRSATQ